MNTALISQLFDERLQEITAYLELLDALEAQLQSGSLRIGAYDTTAQQQRILYSAVYLQLYNLVEATVTWCMDTVAAAATHPWRAGDFSAQLRREWVKHRAKTHQELNEGNRLDYVLTLCESLISAQPIQSWTVERGKGGNWDDLEIETIAKRIGCQLTITREVYQRIKRRIRDDKGALELVKYLRNSLAHGTISFSECGDGVSAKELRDLTNATASYLREVVQAFSTFIDDKLFLSPEHR